MASYPPPSQKVPIFNPSDFETGNTSLTLTTADGRYLQLSGGVERGLVTFQTGLATASISNSGSTFTVPGSSGQLALVSQIPSSTNFVDLTSPQSISGIKTFTNPPVISTITNTGTLTLPTSTDTLIGRNTTDILTNKSLVDASCFWVNSIDNTKKIAWSLGTQTTSTTLTLVSNQTTSQNLNYPNITGTDTISTLGLSQTNTATKNFTGGSGIATSGVYPRTSASNQQTSTFTTPAIQIGGNTNDGIYSSATDLIDIGTQGTNYISLQPQGIYRFVGGTTDPAIVFNVRLQAFNGANGVTSPGIQIDNQNSGFYRVNQGIIGIGISGVATARWSSAGLNLFGVAGTVGAPAIVLSNDTTSGFYRPSANQVAVACSGAQVGNFTSTGLAITGSVSASTTALTGAGSVGTPAIQMGGDTTSGIYRSAANEVAISTSGVQRGKWSSSGLAITGISQTSIPMSCMMTKSTAQSTANGSVVSVVSYDVSSNPSSYFTLSTTNGTITFTVADAPCMIFVSGQIQFPSSTVGVRELWIEDGSGLRWVDFNRNATSDAGDTSKSFISGMRMITTNATYVLTMKIYQNTGGTINSGGIVATNLTTFCCARIN